MSDRIPDDEIDELAELRALARGAGIDADHPLEPIGPPPEGLWDRIDAALRDEQAEPEPDPEPAREPAPAPAVASVTPLRRPARRWLAPLAAAAAVAVIAAGAVVLGGDDEPEPVVVASATLDPLTGAGSGTAELLETDGHLQLRLETADLDAGDGFLEVWVIDTAVERLVSLGPARADGLYDLPPGLDPQTFPIVDVSVEPIDGDPTHSGDSLLRGQLEQA